MPEDLPTAAATLENGLAHRRPIMAGACPTCIWGPIAVLTRQALVAYGYDVQICYNCNRQLSVPSVARAIEPPPLNKWDVLLGDPPPPRGKVDFGVTNSHTLWRAFTGDDYADGPQTHLRLIAYIEDLHLIQVAARRSLSLVGLEDVANKHLPITLLLDGSPFVPSIVAYYGLDKLESWGGTIKRGYGGENAENRNNFDVLITAHGGLANNIENDLLYEVTQKFDLQFLEFAPELMAQMSERFLLEIVPVPVGLLKGIDRPMMTLARNGQSVFGREDLPDDFAYDVARALDENRSKLKYLNRPYFYDPKTVWQGIGSVPLHPGAERYYQEQHYLES
ncbi:MAG TPA: TAXI family TRAP transporter solute-binding subunit [Chloroflexota bacterium]|jgi:hypothetical protein